MYSGSCKPEAQWQRFFSTMAHSSSFSLFTRSQHGLLPTEAALELKPCAEAAAEVVFVQVASLAGDTRGPALERPLQGGPQCACCGLGRICRIVTRLKTASP